MVFAAGSVYLYGICPSLSVPAWAHSSKPAAAGLLLWAQWAEISVDSCMADAHQQQQQHAASESGQCRVVSICRKLNTDLLVLCWNV